MLEYTTKEIVQGISKNENIIVQYVYDKFFTDILIIVENYGGNRDDAFDVFQDAMIILYEEIKSENSKEIMNFKSYFATLCKFTWFNTNRKDRYNGYKYVSTDEFLPEIEFRKVSIIWAEKLEKEKRVRIFISSFIEMKSKCQMIIRMVAYGWKTEDIAENLGMALSYAYKRRKLCIQTLIKLVKQKL